MTTQMKYPKTLAAVKAAEGDQWKIADALVDEIKTSDDGNALQGEFKRAAEWLIAQGFDYTNSRLGKMWLAAETFRGRMRNVGISFEAHLEATGDPKVLAGAKKKYGKGVTKRQVIEYRKALKAARDAARKRRKEKAEQKKREAEEAKRKAEKEKTAEAEEAAEKAAKEAAEAEEEAGPTGTQGVPDPARDAIERQRALFAARDEITAAEKAARKFTEIVKEHDLAGAGEDENLADRLDIPAEIAPVIDAWLMARDDLMVAEQKEEVKV